MTNTHYFPRRSYLDLLRTDTWRIDSGIIRAITWIEDGSPTTLGFWGAGEIVGNALLGSNNYQLECLTPVTAAPLLAANCENVGTLSHIQRLQELLIIRSCKRIEDRLLKLLIWLGRRFGSNEDTGIIFDIFLTHQDLADALSTTRVTITRSLKDLERQGTILHLSNRRLFIVRGASPVENQSAYSSSDPAFQKPVNNLATLVLPVGVATPLWNRPLSVSYR
ncbi:Crp/Fnr family transcriptional regulator [Chamaesiphon sp. VAR_48_metabat_403]|uniref:Crp/Fnr family transcriptional regulator n=1 Tax=Chamaesiphon sp. VAR_48_metabat_403 TaxID=2964700 RepID=UPI00286E7D56|nr:Crp/Fnr family transcriptional regulator [Chamaesiphon sp. VAR_48_metabat_403]